MPDPTPTSPTPPPDDPQVADFPREVGTGNPRCAEVAVFLRGLEG